MNEADINSLVSHLCITDAQTKGEREGVLYTVLDVVDNGEVFRYGQRGVVAKDALPSQLQKLDMIKVKQLSAMDINVA